MRNSLLDCITADAKQLNTEQVLNACGIAVNSRTHKCRCPFHDDKHASMMVYPHNVHCFVCGAHFDNIDFVERFMQLSYRDALSWFNRSFGMGYTVKGNNQQALEQRKSVRVQELERAEAERKAKELKYHLLSDEYIRLDKIRINADPMSDEYADAVKRLPIIEYELDCAQSEVKG